MRLFSNRKRPVHLGPYPLERLPRSAPFSVSAKARKLAEGRSAGPTAATAAYAPYIELCDALRHGESVEKAPIPDDPQERADHLKAGLYFLDADMHHDDKVGNGSINTIKKWWWDLEWIEGRATNPAKGTNARDLDLNGGRVAARQKVAIYPPEVQPPGDAVGVPVKLDRPAAVAAGQAAEAAGIPASKA